MGIDRDFGAAFAKSQAGTGSMVLPEVGVPGATGSDPKVFVSVANRDKRAIVFPAKRLIDLGFSLVATEGTADLLDRAGVPAEVVGKVSRGDRSILRMIESGEVGLVLNTPFGSGSRGDGYAIRQSAVTSGVPCITTLAGILAAIQAVEAVRRGPLEVRSLQEHQASYREAVAAAVAAPAGSRVRADAEVPA
jgi:carbamoyl-phosphate synthase large subunit